LAVRFKWVPRDERSVIAAHLDVQGLARGMDEQHVRGVEATTGQSEPLSGDLGNPEIPDLSVFIGHWGLPAYKP
jgi:hypothetical protein